MPVTTHLFVKGDSYLESDAVFGVKDSLIADFVRHESAEEAAQHNVRAPFYTVEHDWVLEPVLRHVQMGHSGPAVGSHGRIVSLLPRPVTCDVSILTFHKKQEDAMTAATMPGPEDGVRYTTRPLTGDEYLESLQDGREVWIYGERVKDVTTHPAFRNTVRMVARLYDALHDPKTKDMLTTETDTGSGGYTHHFFKASRNREE